MMHVLLLGGTSEANILARTLAERSISAIYSYAGRTDSPKGQPLTLRVGGFGGVDGLLGFLESEDVTHVVDATHPFAAQMSENASIACATAGVTLIRFERPAWEPSAGDNWTSFASIEKIPAALPTRPARIFLAIGKQQIGLFASRPEHHYLLRLVDEPETRLPLPQADIVVGRGPFEVADDLELLERHQITHIVAKNSGGLGARAKLDAARALGLPVLMAERPNLPPAQICHSVDDVLRYLGHTADLGV